MDVESPPGLQEEPGGGHDGVPPEYEIQEEAQLESVRIYDDFEVTAGSKIKDLRTACAWLGISQSGGKQRLFGRIREAHVKGLRRAAVEIANREYLQAAHQAEPAHVASRQPSSRERMLHELTHLPYRDWCPHCVATRSRGDYHASVADPVSTSERDHPIVQMDFFFCEERGGASILLMIDAWTRYVHVEPMEKQTAKAVGDQKRYPDSLEWSGMWAWSNFAATTSVLWWQEWSSVDQFDQSMGSLRLFQPTSTMTKAVLVWLSGRFRLSAICRRHW